MRRLAAACVAAVAIGCGDRPPTGEGDPLPVGSLVLLKVPGKPTNPVPFTDTSNGFRSVDPGVKARVVDDPGGAPDRRVTVTVLEGENEGVAGTISRAWAVPVR